MAKRFRGLNIGRISLYLELLVIAQYFFSIYILDPFQRV